MSSPPTATTLGEQSSRLGCTRAARLESRTAFLLLHRLRIPRVSLSPVGPRMRGLKLKQSCETTPRDAPEHLVLPAFDGRRRGGRSRASYHLRASTPIARAS